MRKEIVLEEPLRWWYHVDFVISHNGFPLRLGFPLRCSTAKVEQLVLSQDIALEANEENENSQKSKWVVRSLQILINC